MTPKKEESENIIIETLNTIKNLEWKLIGGKKKWIKNCPRCHRETFYHSKSNLKRSIEKGSICSICRPGGKGFVHKPEDFQRKCPTCKKILIYKVTSERNRANKNNKLCSSCAQIGLTRNRNLDTYLRGKNHPMYGKKMSKYVRDKLTESVLGKSLTKNHRNKISIGNTGKIRTDEMKRKYSISKTGKNNSLFGTHHSLERKLEMSKRASLYRHTSETKKLLRIKAIERISRQGISRAYNEAACDYFDKLNRDSEWNLQHAKNGGEIEVIGYFPDAYDKERNIIVEYDEPHHYDVLGNLKEKDIIRMNEIIKKTGCTFYRYNEKLNTLTSNTLTFNSLTDSMYENFF